MLKISVYKCSDKSQSRLVYSTVRVALKLYGAFHCFKGKYLWKTTYCHMSIIKLVSNDGFVILAE